MANGYHSDAFPQGCGDENAYYLTHWHVIDAFIYFSHHFVTIPCPTWINSAHRHGVQVSTSNCLMKAFIAFSSSLITCIYLEWCLILVKQCKLREVTSGVLQLKIDWLPGPWYIHYRMEGGSREMQTALCQQRFSRADSAPAGRNCSLLQI